uniref:Uncharacterized protein n=1 Tax=Meloidogyne enterolobii TaxID=390850 RepID=A0A6V7WYD7_MELEN|nr:unnamed protein product [Meloidogyne enterolobii]
MSRPHHGKATARTLSMLKVKSMKLTQFELMTENASILNAKEALIKFIPVAVT